MERLDKKLFEYIKNHKNIKITTQAIRNEISKIRNLNPGITLNAAAYLFAKRRGFKVTRYLNPEDRQSLQQVQNIHTSNIQSKETKGSVEVKKKTINPPFGKRFVAEANANAEAYLYVYILENSLRKIIQDTFSSDPNWWNKKAPTKVKEHADFIKNAEKKHDWLPARGNHPTYYIGLDDLFAIISKNYNPYFKKIFTDQGNLRTWINECVPIRNLLAHNILISKEEKQNLIIRTKYICTLIEKKS